MSIIHFSNKAKCITKLNLNHKLFFVSFFRLLYKTLTNLVYMPRNLYKDIYALKCIMKSTMIVLRKYEILWHLWKRDEKAWNVNSANVLQEHKIPWQKNKCYKSMKYYKIYKSITVVWNTVQKYCKIYKTVTYNQNMKIVCYKVWNNYEMIQSVTKVRNI